jgi:carnitine O-acetyltransferase
LRTSLGTGSGRQIVPSTFGNEDRLPRVPLPTLEESCARFLDWCAPLLSACELAVTKAAVAAFLRPGSPARTLQDALAEYDATDGVHSWLDRFWASRYLGRRDRIALNANYFCLFHDSNEGQIERAAALVAAAVEYKLLLDTERIPPVARNGEPLSMHQNRFLFSATRIPDRLEDSVRAPYSEGWPGPSRERHVVVLVLSQMFRMDVIAPDGRAHTVDELASGLRAVMREAETGAAPRASVGHLTTKPRAEWAESRRALLACHPRNAEALDLIETALFCVCLEERAPGDALEACDQLLYGDSGNRWFDKALSLIVFADGTAGINVEHSRLDGATIVDFVDSVLGRSLQERIRRSRARSEGAPRFEPIVFELDAELEADVHAADASFAHAGAETTTAVLSFVDFGGIQAKELGASPDAFVQMAFQLAHHRARGRVGATYEAIGTRHFHHGRTEAMRVVTPEVVRFVTTMDDPEADYLARTSAFRAAAEKHANRVKECQRGFAPEQHLWELQLIQRRRGTELGVTEPDPLYETPGWLRMRDDYLSTSSTPSTNIRFGGFGPTSSMCIGIAYVLLPERLDLHLSAPRPVADELYLFINKLREAVDELQDLLRGS